MKLSIDFVCLFGFLVLLHFFPFHPDFTFFCLFWSLSLMLKIFLKCVEVHDARISSPALELGQRLSVQAQEGLAGGASVSEEQVGSAHDTYSGPHSAVSVGLFWGVSFSNRNTQRLFLFRVSPSVYCSSGVQGRERS